VSLREATEQMIAAKTNAGRRKTYMDGLAYSLRALIRGREEMPIAQVTVEHVEEWCVKPFANRSTQRSYTRALGILIRYGIRRRWTTVDPTAQLEPISIDLAPPAIFTPDQCRRLMDWVSGRMPDALALVSLGLFAGVRPEEISRLGWESVDLAKGTLTVDAAASKTGRRRIVHLEPAALAWIAEAKRVGALLPYPNRRRLFRQRHAARHLGLKGWPKDVLRHSAASYLYAAWRDAGKVAAELGNSASILMRHYRELVSAEDAAAFWALRPAVAGA
jgi:integrase